VVAVAAATGEEGTKVEEVLIQAGMTVEEAPMEAEGTTTLVEAGVEGTGRQAEEAAPEGEEAGEVQEMVLQVEGVGMDHQNTILRASPRALPAGQPLMGGLPCPPMEIRPSAARHPFLKAVGRSSLCPLEACLLGGSLVEGRETRSLEDFDVKSCWLVW
jgi:hypothetical protein